MLLFPTLTGLTLGDMKDGETLLPGKIYIPTDEYHMSIRRTNAEKGYILRRDRGAKVHGHCPAVDPLFESAAKLGISCAAFLLTGMGSDGAQGMKQLAETGMALTFAQDEESCVVFGMPRAAIRPGAARYVGNLVQLRGQLDKIIEESRKERVVA